MLTCVTLQIDFVGKGGPGFAGAHGREYDVRLVHVKVMGDVIPDLAADHGALTVGESESAYQVMQEANWQKHKNGPKFGSSDSERTDPNESDFYLDYLDSLIS